MTPIHRAGEMAVWSEERWAAFETDLQRELRRERQRLQRMQRGPQPLVSPLRRAAPALALGVVAIGLLALLLGGWL